MPRSYFIYLGGYEMSKTLNFNTMKKQYLTVTLPDEKKTTIMVSTPTKSTMTELIELGDRLSELDQVDNLEIIDSLYDFCARLLSVNKARIEINKEYLEDIFDIEDIVVLFKTYTEFVNGVYKTKN